MERGDIYIVGLDTHVAFLVWGGSEGFRFIHSSGSRPWCVVDESRADAGCCRRHVGRAAFQVSCIQSFRLFPYFYCESLTMLANQAVQRIRVGALILTVNPTLPRAHSDR